LATGSKDATGSAEHADAATEGVATSVAEVILKLFTVAEEEFVANEELDLIVTEDDPRVEFEMLAGIDGVEIDAVVELTRLVMDGDDNLDTPGVRRTVAFAEAAEE
jgi:hypothetical protein